MLDVYKNLVAILIGTIIAAILAEIILRLVPDKVIGNSTFSRRADKRIGLLNTPNQKSSWNSECFRIFPISTNSFGYRDNEWNVKTGFKILVLGDSFMEALEVSDGNTASDRLERLLNVEVLNAGFSGYGTVAELSAYREFFKPFKPKIVILFFLTANDIRDNSCELTKIVVGKKRYLPCSYISNGTIRDETNFSDPYHVTTKVDSYQDALEKMKGVISKYSVTYRALHKILKNIKKGSLPADGYVYMPAVAKDWKDAWEITEKKLVDLNNEIKTDGGKLLITTIPDYLRISKDWRQEFIKEAGVSRVPEDFDPFLPVKKLESITKKYNMIFLQLEPYFIEYRDKFDLKTPYFSYWCNGHWNPLGHFLSANIIARFLIEGDMILLEELKKMELLEKIKNNLNYSPLQILGLRAYEQIYNHGVYSPAS